MSLNTVDGLFKINGACGCSLFPPFLPSLPLPLFLRDFLCHFLKPERVLSFLALSKTHSGTLNASAPAFGIPKESFPGPPAGPGVSQYLKF